MNLRDMMKMEMNDVQQLCNSTMVRRVPGGWIYTTKYMVMGGGAAITSRFVPQDTTITMERA